MKNALEQLSTYKSFHLNQRNLMTHFVGIPMIIFSVLIPMGWFRLNIGDSELSGALIFVIGVLGYYLFLNAKLALGMAVFIMPVYYFANQVSLWEFGPSLQAFLFFFIVGWAFQFIGHKFEKKKPAFVDDVNQLLIGPFFLMSEIYFALGLLKDLAAQVEKIGQEKRKKMDNLPYDASVFEFSKATSLAGRAPSHLGIHNGKLMPCPNLPLPQLRKKRNCVASQDSDPRYHIAPLAYTSSPEQARADLKKVLKMIPGTQLLRETPDYWHVEFTSKKLGFVDDVEFQFQDGSKLIHLRSASRLGYSDFGANRCRVEELRKKFDILQSPA